MAIVGQQPAFARPVAPNVLTAPTVASMHGRPVAPKPRPADLSQGATTKAPAVVWPAAGVGRADLRVGPATWTARRRDGGQSTSQAGTLPVYVTAVDAEVGAAGATTTKPLSTVKVTLLDRGDVAPAWRNGLVLQAARADGVTAAGRASISVDYSGFARAFGGDWAARLRLVSLPTCALTTPELKGCQATSLVTRNDRTTRLVSADIMLPPSGGVTLALAAGPKSSAGNFTVSSLQASSTWSAGGNTGGFSWDYPLRTPPSLGGPGPKMSLAYSSTAVDGRNEATNNQPSWIGEGFDWWPGYIERRYKVCGSDTGNGANNTTETGDQCWATDNANMSLNGSGGELIKDGATGIWRLKNDDNSKVERLANTVNGDNDNEYWKITTANGTQYFFGRNRLPGYTGTAPANKTTNSTWTVPVAGNHSGEPCHAASFISSFCSQAWRWNLDYVVDPHGNTMSLFYAPETNKYARNNTDTDMQTYTRGGSLDHIDYGTDNRTGTDTENTTTAAPMRVTFAGVDRCLTSCWTGSNPNTANWPDTPWDQYCAPSATSCPGLYSPVFFTSKRLGTVTTKVWNASAVPPVYKEVDAWTLSHTFPDPGDGTRAGLWLESIVHTGAATGPAVIGSTIAMPEVNFDWVQMPNRVDSVTDGKFPMNWMRISTIWTETGGKIDVRYTGADCVAGSHLPASPPTNTLRCYPVLEEQSNHSIKTEYFHKYLVTDVTKADLTGAGLDVVTNYEYVGTPAWRHTDDDGITQDNLRTWSDYRGYSQVNTRVGQLGSGSETLTETVFFRGMNGDLDGSGGTRSVTLPAVDGNGDGDTADTADAPAIADENAYSGRSRKTTVFNGVETAPVSATITKPWQSAPTASRDMGQTTTYARHIGTEANWSATKLGAGGWRVARSDFTLDSYGLQTQVDDQGDVAASGDELCVKSTYNRNTGLNVLSIVGRTETYALRCATPPASEADVISDIRTSFDGQVYGAAPTEGDPTRVEIAESWSSGSGSTWLTQSTSAFDDYGRPSDIADVRGNHTTTSYTPSAGGPVTAVAVTTLLGTTTTTVEPAWGTTTAVVDMNSKRTEATFDALGRTRQVWLANHIKASFPSAPSTSYTYLVRSTGGVNAVTTAQLNAASTATNSYYTTSYTLFDGLLRQRQTQQMSMAVGNVGTVFSETKYDDKGRVASQSQHSDATVQPGTTLFTIADWVPKTQTASVYDRAGRVTASVFNSSGVEQWRTTTSYGGDRVNTVPPQGGTATTTINDARGRTVELREYHNPADVGSNTRTLYDAATYHFNAKGQRDSVTDNAGNVWIYMFDLLGRQTGSDDPDKGNSTTTYNSYGDVTSTTDARGQRLEFGYDSLGRKTSEYAGSVAPANLLASWTYDPLGFKGQLSYSSRWTNNGTTEYRTKIRSYNQLYQPTGVDYIIPTALTGLSGTYSVVTGYRYNGSPATVGYPAGGGLGGETVTYTYDSATGLPEQLLTGTGAYYVFNTDYNAYGEMSFVQYQQQAGAWLQRAFTYDDATRRLKRATTIRQTSPQAVDDVQYGYDAVGNITNIVDTAASGAVDTQCFGHDYARRLADAWTPVSGDCNQAKSAAALGGPAPYWLSWTFDLVGNRDSQTSHATGGDTTTDYTYPAAGTDRPHALSTTTTGALTQNYAYDLSGNTTCRPSGTGANTCPPGAGSQTLAWDAEGHLASNASGGATSSYIYTAEGTRLVADDPTSTTLYLPNMELKRDKTTGTVTPTRYFTWAGQTCAMKTTGGAVTWLVGDHQGTQQISVAAGNQAITQRRQTPYGGARGTVPGWPNPKGFVGGNNDTTGLVHIGAREYDAVTGRFLSVDQIMKAGSPQSWTGYAYSGNSAITFSDPTGLDPCLGGGGGCYHDGTDSHHGKAEENDPCSMSVPGGGCAWRLGKEPVRQIREGNIRNGSDKIALDSVVRDGGSCEIREYQIYCFNVRNLYGMTSVQLPSLCMGCEPQSVDVPLRVQLPVGRAMTVGDVVMYNGTKESFLKSLEVEREFNDQLMDLARERNNSEYDIGHYGRHVEQHEARHAEQWAESDSVEDFALRYGYASLQSLIVSGAPDSHNRYEMDANPYWGGYWDPPLPSLIAEPAPLAARDSGLAWA